MLPTTVGRPGHAALALLVIGLAALVPLWSVAALPASDYPAHLARLHLNIHAAQHRRKTGVALIQIFGDNNRSHESPCP